MGKVHGSLARAGKVKSQVCPLISLYGVGTNRQCPKVEKQEKKKQPKGRASEWSYLWLVDWMAMDRKSIEGWMEDRIEYESKRQKRYRESRSPPLSRSKKTVHRNGVVAGQWWNRRDLEAQEVWGRWRVKRNKREFRTSTTNRHNHYSTFSIAPMSTRHKPSVHSATYTIGRSAELTSQGRGHSTTDDSSTLPSHQEESEGCELLFHLSSCSVISLFRHVVLQHRCSRFARTTPPYSGWYLNHA